ATAASPPLPVRGGLVGAFARSPPPRATPEASFRLQREIERGERVVVGVNRVAERDDDQTAIRRSPAALERKQVGRLHATRARRDPEAVEDALTELRLAAAGDANLIEPLLDCARAGCSEGEIVESLQRVFGTYTETPVF
ncbi:MAG: methylmalonyl-CoA mutase family protein, partial [Nocardioidaceae bacterium]